MLIKSFGCDNYSSIPVYTVTLESDQLSIEHAVKSRTYCLLNYVIGYLYRFGR